MLIFLSVKFVKVYSLLSSNWYVDKFKNGFNLLNISYFCYIFDYFNLQ